MAFTAIALLLAAGFSRAQGEESRKQWKEMTGQPLVIW
jgi:2-C-methyl-D-erythritol 4-phosphate cytidylyltransferase